MRNPDQMFMFYGALLSNPSVMPEGILTQTKESQQSTINKLNRLAEMAYDKMLESTSFDEDDENDLNQIYDSNLR